MKTILWGLLGLFVCAAHAAATVLYLAPANLLTNRMIGKISDYMHPIFYQDWHLFSPDPGFTTTQLWLRCGAGESWSPWFDPFASLQQRHYETRVTGRGKLLYVYYGMPRSLNEAVGDERATCHAKAADWAARGPFFTEPDLSACNDGELAKAAATSESYDVASRFASDVCDALAVGGRRPAGFQIRVVNLTPKRFSRRDEPGDWESVQTFEFPPDSIRTTAQRKIAAH